MIARLYANENFPLPVVFALRELGHDVLTSSTQAGPTMPFQMKRCCGLRPGTAVP